MSKAKSTVVSENLTLIGDDSPAEMALSETLAQLGSDEIDAKVWCYKFDPKTGQRAYLFTASPEEFRLGGMDQLRDQYGSGEYNVRVYAGGHLAANQKITIVASLAASHASAGGSISGMRELMQEQQAALSSTLAGGLNAIAQAMQSLQSQKPPTLLELMQSVQMLQAMAPKPISAENPFGMMKSMLEAMREMREIIPNSDNDNDPMLSAFTRVIEPILSKAMISESAAVPIAPAVALSNPAQPLPALQPIPLSDEAQMRILIKQFVSLLVSNARQNNPVETYAEMTVDNAPEPLLRQLANDPMYLDKLAEYDPGVRMFPQWFERLRAEVKVILTEMEKPDKPVAPKIAKAAHAIKPD